VSTLDREAVEVFLQKLGELQYLREITWRLQDVEPRRRTWNGYTFGHTLSGTSGEFGFRDSPNCRKACALFSICAECALGSDLHGP